MQHEVMTFLEDIRESAYLIKKYLSECPSYSAFEANFMMRDAVERRFPIIGEALHQANKRDHHLKVSEKQKIIGLRHILVHEYHRAEPDRLWLLCHVPLDILINEITQILTNNSSARSQTATF